MQFAKFYFRPMFQTVHYIIPKVTVPLSTICLQKTALQILVNHSRQVVFRIFYFEVGAEEHGMRIYAYKDDMPGKDTLLYVAPFFNVTGSSVCLGSANIDLPKNLTYESLLQYWEKKFWLTEFSH